MLETDVPARLKSLRERTGLSIRAVAAELGMSPSGYVHYENPERFKSAYLPMDVARDLAALLGGHGVPPDQVMALAGSTAAPPNATPTPSRAAPAGFAEGSAAPWSPAPAARDRTTSLLAALAPQTASPGTYIMTRTIEGLGLMRGDVIVVDRRALPAPGQLALGNARDGDDRMVTVIGRYHPPLLITPESLTGPQVLDTTNGDVAVYHPIVAQFRQYEGGSP